MNFGKVLFGFAHSEVEKHIAMLEAQLYEKKKNIQRLEHSIQMPLSPYADILRFFFRQFR